MTDFSVDFELLPRNEIQTGFVLEPRSEMGATFELNILAEGPQGPIGPEGPRGPVGPPGQDAKIIIRRL